MTRTRAGAGYVLTLGLAAAGVMGALAAGAPRSALPAVTASLDSPAPRYDRDIRPILSDRCFKCHGPDAAKRQADLRLDVAEGATAPRRHGAAIVPGDADSSELWERVTSDDADYRMPPPDSNKRPLSAEEQDLVRRWIQGGAAYEPHWSFVPPERPPEPRGRNESWARNPIDRFILAALEAAAIEPSPEAEKPTLLRRVFLDLTGLPPTPEELDEFLADARPDAYERWVDRLLTTEPYKTRYAERMATPWMDQARYADTCGIHMDAGRQMWLWRDWVIGAYRDNVPFDRFIVEQMAGDLIPDATDQQKIASGFNRCHVTTDEGGAINDEYLVEYAVDRTATSGSVFLGLTLGCARCHDHKFDPVSQQDFYNLYAYFNSIEEPGLYSQTPDPNRAHEPFLVVPTPEQRGTLAKIADELAVLKKKQEERTPEEEQQRTAFLAGVIERAGVAWAATQVTGAASTGGSKLEPQPDGSVRATGDNPKQDDYTITIRTEGTGLRLVALEALGDGAENRPGRAANGNAMVSGLVAEAVSVADPLKREPIRFAWAWADQVQQNEDSSIVNLFDPGPNTGRGWALGGHAMAGARTALFLADKPFGYEGGTEIRFSIQQRTRFDYHNLARVRLGVGTLNEAGLALLPVAPSRWHSVGPFPPDKDGKLFEVAYGPEDGDALDAARNFGFGNQYWRFNAALVDDRPAALAEGRNVSYVGRHLFSPTAREIEVSLGSDDGFRLFVNGVEAASRQVDRAVAPDQDKARISLRPGRNLVVLKIVNTGGPAAYYYRSLEKAELPGDLVAALVDPASRASELEKRLETAWRAEFLPSYRNNAARMAALDKQKADTDAATPRTMVMKELEKRRDTFLLTRGVYDKPDKTRPAHRTIPASLGKLPDGAPDNRLGLAQWLVSPDNPLTARVTVNRLWELFFGAGLVRTTEDFGLQGEFPSHPELLDWLAVEFRQSGWDVHRLIKLIVTSSTYRQSSRARPDVADQDPANRLLAFYPRRRLTAEQIRDEALYVSGLLVEKAGGPSVKPYQPEGLWQEVAMIQSNTREYKPGAGDDFYRRSLYIYWKRAAPPPSMLTFDAPTREACTIRRSATDTPLQALVLWNDEQFVEAARGLAQRTLAGPGDDDTRLTEMLRRCTGHAPESDELAALRAALADFRSRFTSTPADAEGILKKGMAPTPPTLDRPELASWTMIASGLFSLYQTTTQE